MDVSASTATLNGSLDSIGDYSSLEAFFEYGKSASYGSTTSKQTLFSTGGFSETLSLEFNQTYHYRAVVKDGSTTWYGNDVSFQTSGLIAPTAQMGAYSPTPLLIPISVPSGEVGHIIFDPTWDANQIFITLGRSACHSPSPVPDFYLQAPGERSAYQISPITAEIAAPIPVIRTATDGLSPLVPYVNIASAPSAVRPLVVSPDVGYPIWATGSAVVAEAPIRNSVNNVSLGSISSLGRVWWKWDADPVRARTLYRVVLTGAADGVPDVELPATHIHVRRREDKELSYIEVETAPLADTAARIADRSSGQILIDRGVSVGFGWHWTRIAQARLDDVEVLRERRFRLSGRGSELEPADRTMILRPSYRNEENEELRLRSAVDPFLAPGDRVNFQDRVVTVREISYYIAVSDEQMEIEGI